MMTDPPPVDEKRLDKMRHCAHSAIYCDTRTLMPDYHCQKRFSKPLCKLYFQFSCDKHAM